MLEQQPFVHSQDVREGLKRIVVKHSRVDEITDELGETVYGQERAVRKVAQRLSLIEAGINPTDKPLGGMIFLGPTGVGKTELVRAVSDHWFADQRNQRMLKINGGEYTQEHEIAKFIGSPNGYVGENNPGIIRHNWLHETDSQGRQRKSIVMFDEVEKMHPSIFEKIILPILDDATLVTRKGREGFAPLHFNNTLLIATGNLGSKEIAEIASGKSFGFGDTVTTEKKRSVDVIAHKALRGHFAPEVVNRFTDIVVFNSLQKESGVYEQIFDKLMDERRHAMAVSLKTRTPALHVADDVKQKIIDSVDTRYGARDLGRAIDKQLLYGFSDIVNTMYVSRMQIWACLDEEGKIGFYASRLPRIKKRPNPPISSTDLDTIPKQPDSTPDPQPVV